MHQRVEGIGLSILSLLFATGGLTACHGEQATTRVYENAVTFATKAGPVRMQLSGPRQLTQQELAQLERSIRPTGSSAVTGEASGIGTPDPSENVALADENPVDLTGFTIEVQAPAGARAASAGVDSTSQSLTGTVTAGGYALTGSVAQGGTVTYQFNAIISDGILQPTSGNADLYGYNCNGAFFGGSTNGGIYADFFGIYNSAGTVTCRQFRVYGALASNYRMTILYYN